MTQANNSKTTSRRLFVLIGLLICLFAATVVSIFLVRIPFQDITRLFMVLFGFCALIALLTGNLLSRKNVLLPLFALAIVIGCSTIATYLLAPETRSTFISGVRQVSDAVLWIGIFAWAYYIGNHGINVIEKTEKVAWATIPFFVLLLGVLEKNGEYAEAMRSASYYVLFLLPVVLMMKNRKAKLFLTLVVFVAVLLSAKRGGFVAFILAVAVYYAVKFRHTPSRSVRKLKMVLGALAMILLGYIILHYCVQKYDLGIIDRMLAIQEDSGSGRILIWKETMGMIGTSDPVSLIFGHGFNRVYFDSTGKLSAHNDILEVLYDYGIAGTILYIAVIAKVFATYKRVVQKKPDLAAPYAVSLTLFLCMSAVSHLVIYPTYFLFLCAYWGFVMGELDLDVTIRRKV